MVTHHGVGCPFKIYFYESASSFLRACLSQVHERNAEIDFLLIILKDLLTRRPDLKLVLMSATLNAGLFANFFQKFSTVVLEIPGRTFPVSRMCVNVCLYVCMYAACLLEMHVRSCWRRAACARPTGGAQIFVALLQYTRSHVA